MRVRGQRRRKVHSRGTAERRKRNERDDRKQRDECGSERRRLSRNARREKREEYWRWKRGVLTDWEPSKWNKGLEQQPLGSWVDGRDAPPRAHRGRWFASAIFADAPAPA